MPNGLMLEGRRFGKLVVLSRAERPAHFKQKRLYWLCQCDCGNTTIVSGSNLVTNGTVSCGCGRRESKAKTHGFASHKKYDKLYHTWNGIKYRCYNPKSKDFKNYGQRGIRMCEEWLRDFMAFRNWALENGFAENLTIDRIEVDGNYEPSNCRWITVAEQNRNKTTTRKDG